MTDIAAVEILTLLVNSLIAPFLTGVLTHANMKAEVKSSIALLVSIVLGVLYAVIVGIIIVPFEVSDFLIKLCVGVGAIIPISQGFYKALKPTVKAVEKATGRVEE